MIRQLRLNWKGVLIAAVTLVGLVLGIGQASAAIVWVDPNTYSLGSAITPPFVTLQAIQGATTQSPPSTPTVYALADDKGHYSSDMHFFGWKTLDGSTVVDKPAWRQKWAVLKAEFDSPVAVVSMDFYRNDFSGGPLTDELAFLTAFNSVGTPISTVPVSIVTNATMFTATISFSSPDIKYVMASGLYNPSEGIDHDILITRLGYSTTALVPEPISLVGLASGGAALAMWMGLRRRRPGRDALPTA